MTHPVVGPLHLRYDRLAIIESPGLLLVLHQAEPDSPSATALKRLSLPTDVPGFTADESLAGRAGPRLV
jgi:hypothetical protein